MARRKTRTYSSCPVAGTRERLSARQSQRSFGTGPRFPLDVALKVARGRERKSEVSASSWQGLLVVPGGAPAPPGCLVERQPDPQAPHLVPPHERLMMRPSSGRGGRSVGEVWMAGISHAASTSTETASLASREVMFDLLSIDSDKHRLCSI